MTRAAYDVGERVRVRGGGAHIGGLVRRVTEVTPGQWSYFVAWDTGLSNDQPAEHIEPEPMLPRALIKCGILPNDVGRLRLAVEALGLTGVLDRRRGSPSAVDVGHHIDLAIDAAWDSSHERVGWFVDGALDGRTVQIDHLLAIEIGLMNQATYDRATAATTAARSDA